MLLWPLVPLAYARVCSAGVVETGVGIFGGLAPLLTLGPYDKCPGSSSRVSRCWPQQMASWTVEFACPMCPLARTRCLFGRDDAVKRRAPLTNSFAPKNVYYSQSQ